LAEREFELEEAVQVAARNDMSESSVSQLRELVRSSANAFRRALGGDPPARVEPLKVKFKPGAVTIEVRPRSYSLSKAALLAG
ncbi:unnamed protein product, partial [Sphacelaria rigidula]